VDSRNKRLLWVAVAAVAAMWLLVAGVLAADRFEVRPAGVLEATPSKPSGDGPLPVLWKAPSFTALDQDGRVVTDATLEHRPWIADFIFTRCTTACPLISAKLVLVRRAIASKDVRFVSFSVDPDFDTPAVLKTYARRWGEDPRWLLLSARPADVQDVARAMKVPLERTSDPANPVLHTTLFFLVDGAKTIRGIYDSTDDDAVKRLARDADCLAGAPAAQPVGPGPAGPPDPDRGRALFASVGCAGCHADERVAPPLAGVSGGAVRLEGDAAAMADDAYLTESILEPDARIVAGYSSLMPSYRDHLSAGQVADLVAYVRSMPSTGPAGAPEPVAQAEKVDPVCGMHVHVVGTTPQARYKDRTYYFCSEVCRDRFLKAPDRFASRG
jgi:protein SCO1